MRTHESIARRSGFTIVELVLALSIGATVVTIAAGVLSALQRMGTSINQYREEKERYAHAWTLAHESFAMVKHPKIDERTLHADSQSVRLTSRCRSPWGGRMLCDVEFLLVHEVHESQLILREPEQLATAVRTVDRTARWEWYDPEQGGRWQSQWSHAGRLPLVARIVGSSDTMWFEVGAHR